MPITDLGSYSTTGQEFAAHWALVNADRTANTLPALTLPPNYDLDDFNDELEAVQTMLADIENLENATELAIGVRDSLREGMRIRIQDFRNAVRFYLKGTEWVGTLPKLPHSNSSEQRIVNALDDVASVWPQINAASDIPNFTAPLLLREGYALATFTSDYAALRAAYKAVTDAEVGWTVGRRRRDKALKAFRKRMVLYRQAIRVLYPEDHELTQSLPDVYAPEGEGNGSGGGGGGPPPVPASPSAPELTYEGSGQVNADWPDVPHATGYNVYKMLIGTDLDFELLGASSISQSNISSLPPGETLRVKISAFNVTGESTPGPYAEIVLPE